MESKDERVFAMRSGPTRMESFCRNLSSNMRVNWTAPKGTMKAVFRAVSEISGLMDSDPQAFESKYATASSTQSKVGMGWSSEPISECTIDGIWEAMTYKIRKPAEFL